MSRYAWTVRCLWCTAVDTFTTELAAQTWAATHDCDPIPDTPEVPVSNTPTQPERNNPS